MGDVICHAYRSWEDGSWSFLPDRVTENGDCPLVTLHSLYQRDPSIGELADLPCGWKASRTGKNQPWKRAKDHPYPEHSEQRYYLIEVANYPSVYPALPDQEKRQNLAAGDLVKLLFRFADESAPFVDYDTERMCVRIEHVDTDYERYHGVLENDPKHEGVIGHGTCLWFSPNHVLSIYDASEDEGLSSESRF